MKKKILFVQRRPTRAGAQTSLFRLASISPLEPIVLTAGKGWLTSALPDTLTIPWPSPRSMAGRLGGLRRVAKVVSKNLHPAIIVANDHQECPMALALAKTMGVPCIAILRTPGMSQRDFEKYHCSQCDHLFIVGEELCRNAQRWTSTKVSLFQEGFLENEFSSASNLAATFPSEILIAGSSEPRKGFSDLIEALVILESRHTDLPFKKISLTGTPLKLPTPDLRCKIEFVGRVDEFIRFAQRFQFAIHPSRSETFGLAPLELIIAGIPTLCTETGCANREILPQSWRTPPSSPLDLANAIDDWIQNWDQNQGQLPDVTDTIRNRFHIERTSAEFVATIEKITSQFSGPDS